MAEFPEKGDLRNGKYRCSPSQLLLEHDCCANMTCADRLKFRATTHWQKSPCGNARMCRRHTNFETQGRCYQRSKTDVSRALIKGITSSKLKKQQQRKKEMFSAQIICIIAQCRKMGRF